MSSISTDHAGSARETERAERAPAVAPELELAREQAKRARAEAAQEEMQFLAEAGSVLSSSLDYETTLANLAHLAVPRLADWCAIDVLEEDGGVRRVVTAHQDPERERLAVELAERYPSDPEAPGGVREVMRTGRPELVREIPPELLRESAVDEEHLRLIEELQLRSYMVVPLVARGSALGAITFVSAESGELYDEQDLAFVQELAHRAALAVDNARLFREAEASREQITRVLESIADAFFALDHEWRFTYLNDEAERLLRSSREELLGESVWERFPEATGSRFEQEYRRAVATQRTITFEEYFAPLDGWFEVRAFPSPDGLSVYFRNVNERHRAESELRESEERFRSLVEATAAIVWYTPASGEFTERQPEWSRFTGQTDEEVMGWGWLDAVHPDDRPQAAAGWMQALRTVSVLELEYRLRRNDGVYRHMLVRAVPILDRDGEIREWVGANTDISELKEAQEERERLINALEVERRRLENVFENAPAAIAVTRGPEHRFISANPAYHRLVARQVVGRTMAEAFPELADQGFFELMEQVRTSGEAYVGSETYIRFDRDGDGVMEDGYFNFVYQPLVDSQGSVQGVMTFAVEVTDLVRARQAAERLEERLRLALESANVGTWDFHPRTGALNWDERCKRIFGIPPETAMTFDLFLEALLPEDRERTDREVQSALDPDGSGSFDTEYRVRWPDGDIRWIRANGKAFFEGEGAARRAVRFIGTVIDVTGAKRAEIERERLIGALDVERARLQEIFRRAPAIIATLRGPEHVFESANPPYLEMVGRQDIIGKSIDEALPEVVEQGFVQLLDRVYETGEPFVGTEVPVLLRRGPDGPLEELFINFVYQPLRESDGSTSGIFVHGVDVTEQVRARHEVERKAAELGRLARALEVSNRELDQFAYVASHDLKAPLRGIANLSTWIEEDLEDAINGEVKEHLDLLRGRVHRMEGLIDGILQYSRAGRVKEKPEEVDSGALVEEVLDLLSLPEAVDVEVQEGMPTLVAERLPLQQVFMNLISNAVKYNDSEHPRVEVGWRDEGEAVEFHVSDNGPGIDPEYHDRIFGIFQTLEARDKVEGTGIGLSLVKKLVESRGGQVWLESQPGEGATFRWLWPKRTRSEGDR